MPIAQHGLHTTRPLVHRSAFIGPASLSSRRVSFARPIASLSSSPSYRPSVKQHKTPSAPKSANLDRLRALLSHFRLHSTTAASNMSSVAAESKDGSEFFRLPRSILPTHYDLTVLSDLKALTFSGLVTIHFDVHEDTDRVTVNLANPKLTVNKGIVASDALKTESRSVSTLELDSKHERASIKLASKLPKGSKATLTIAFESDIDKSMTGYYQSSWEHEGEKGFYALTQFEPTAARRAFPCFDEPEMKATFTFTMIHRKDTVPLGNMPTTSTKDITLNDAHKLLRLKELEVQSTPDDKKGKTETKTTDADEWSITTFDKTPILPTYLVAWANGHFEHIESSFKSIDGRTVPLRVYTTKEFIHQAHYALEVKAKVLPVYEKVFEERFMMPKCDTLIASDFDAGAMENAGLITGRTVVYLYDPAKTGLAGQKRTASVQSHEVAHQWFGNLATMAWWTQLWLNESFATLMGESIILDMCFPEWNSASEFITQHLFRALSLDSKRSSHPIEATLQGENVESAINQIFDAISYAKGASVLRMLSEMIGQDVFLKGVANYISKHKFGNAETVDLWNGISEVSKTDVATIMEAWVLKQGFPVVTVTEEGDSIRVKQNRFLLELKPEEDETLWHIPLMVKHADGTVQRDVFLTEREKTLPIPSGGGAWKLNAGTIGVYRVAYPAEHLSKLADEASKTDSKLTLEDRVGLVSDAFVLAQTGYAKTSGALTMIKALRNDPTNLVNSALATSLAELASVWWEEPEEVREAINKFRADVFGPAAKRLGFAFPEGESPEAREVRSTVIGAAASAGDSWVVEQMRENFAPMLKDPQDDSKIHPDLLQATLRTVVKHGGRAEYDTIRAVYSKPATPSHKMAAMLAMGASTDEKTCQETIDFLYKNVKEQDFLYYFASLSGNPTSRRMFWKSVQENFEALEKRLKGSFALTRLAEYVSRSFTTQKDYDAIRQFFVGKDTHAYKNGLEQGLDAVRANTFWLTKDREDVREWLQANKYL